MTLGGKKKVIYTSWNLVALCVNVSLEMVIKYCQVNKCLLFASVHAKAHEGYKKQKTIPYFPVACTTAEELTQPS